MAPPVGTERLWESPAPIKLHPQQQQQQQQRPDSQALDYSLCSGRSVIVSSAGDSTQAAARAQVHAAAAAAVVDDSRMEHDDDDDDTPMICMICEDKATGLHYGIITCEG